MARNNPKDWSFASHHGRTRLTKAETKRRYKETMEKVAMIEADEELMRLTMENIRYVANENRKAMNIFNYQVWQDNGIS